ncbi:MAG: hypothetical protein ACKO6Q_08275 [Bacteroidota bacterium]
MRIFIRSSLLVFGVLLNHAIDAQCTIFNPAIKLNRTTASTLAGACDINLDLYFDLQSNAGGKYVYVHIWPKAQYPNLIYNNPPNLTQLANAVATLGFYHFGGSLYMLNSYTPYPTVPNFKFTGLSIVKGAGSIAGSDRFTIQNITITGASGCGVAQDYTADVWESQSASAQNVHCFSKGLNFFANDPRVTGFLICELPRQFRFQIRTIDTSGLTVNYKAYIDNGDGVYNAASDSIEIASGSNIVLNEANAYTFNSPLLGYLPYANRKPEAERALWIVVTSTVRDNASYARLDNNCALLPIQLGNFTAKWREQQVRLEWTTYTETENSGFAVERKYQTDGSDFRTIGFVPSRATQGNSSSELTYQFDDPNPVEGTVLYRLKQIDLSGKQSYSPVRMLTAQNMINQLQPNPAD